ncbi:MAG: LuxR C-terminal-related transcriptional regulator, partial [Ilumatobacteraceae bacterium]
IASALFISLSTVKTHLTSIQTKLRLRNRVQIAIWVTEHDPPARPRGCRDPAGGPADDDRTGSDLGTPFLTVMMWVGVPGPVLPRFLTDFGS